jgi:hypothetical protein
MRLPHAIAAALLLLAGSTAAVADDILVAGLGNGLGWNDGLNYTGYANVAFQGQNFPSLAVGIPGGAAGWDATYVPLTDTANILDVMRTYYPGLDDSAYLPKLFAAMIGWEQLSSADLTEAASIDIQHAVWSLFDPAYSDTIQLFQTSQTAAPNGFGSLNLSDGRQIQVDAGIFGLLVDANYATGSGLHELYMIDAPVPQVPEPASLVLGAAGLLLLAALRRGKATP